jgi:hypothetical protein
MDDFIENLARGNVAEVKVVLATVVLVLTGYQVFMMAVVYGKLKLPFLDAKPASFAHRSVGDMLTFVTIAIAIMCIGYFEIQDGIEHAAYGEQGRAALHVVAAIALLAVLALKIVVVRWWHGLSRFLPVLGLTVFVLFAITWASSAGDYLFGG